MTFEEILDQAVAMLQRRGRVTYRALQAQFQLDDGLLETLKGELLFSHPVIDKEGRGLEWTGNKEDVPESTSQPDQTTLLNTQDQPTLIPVESHTPDAERRQLTVMFCDLVGSTSLSGQLDPEDLREVVKAYQSACTNVIGRYDGYVAQLLGDGLLIYFGYPVAHEDDAQRAVHSGLGIIDAIENLNISLEKDKDVKLAVRLGVHTGLVVIGEMGGEGRQEQLALGETPNVAARIQGVADPDTLLISDATYHLVQGFFDCESLGKHELKGVAELVAFYHVLKPSGAQSRLDVAGTRGLTSLVGRESESTLLFERWERVKNGNGQVVLLSGEAGIGKSRLVQALKEYVTESPYTRLECRSSPYFTNSALYPVIDMVQRTLQFQTGDTPELKLEKLERNLRQYRPPLEESVPLFAALLSILMPEDRYPSLNFSPQLQRQKTLEAIVAITLELSERQPVLLILEDLHWTDPTTLEFLDLLIDQTPTTSICVLVTCRPEFQPSWGHRSYLTEMPLNRLSRNQVERIAQRVTDGKRLPAEVIQQLVDKADGVPLYVEEMTKSVLESGALKEVDGEYELAGSISSLTIPATLRDSLMSRLDRLVTAKGIAQYASVIGRQFTYELLKAILELDEVTLQRELRRLVEAEMVYQRGIGLSAAYIFKHALIQDIAYESLLRSTRQNYHRRIAEALEERFPETAEAQPELLAYHFTEAKDNEQAAEYWQKAGQRASERSAYVEAIEHLNKGLELLNLVPDTPERIQRELDLQTTLGPALVATRGQSVPEVEHVYKKARELCQQIGNARHLFPVLAGLRRFYSGRANYQIARELGEQLLTLALREQESILLVEAHYSLGHPLFYLGELTTACTLLEQGSTYYAFEQHRARRAEPDPGIGCLSYLAFALYLLGYPNQARRRSSEALALAHKLSHPRSLSYAWGLSAVLHQFCREVRVVHEQAEAAIAVTTEHGYTQWLALGEILRGWARTFQEPIEDNVAHVRQGLLDWQATGTELHRTYYLSLLAEVYERAGQAEKGHSLLSEALTLVDQSGERFWEAEVHRLCGHLLLSQSPDNQTEAESCFYQALATSRHQQAKSLELRAATSLARLWQSQEKHQEAYDLLSPVYNWFTEGHDTADLIDAKTLMDQLSGPSRVQETPREAR